MSLAAALQSLAALPPPPLPSPPSSPKRASVALILRLHPHPSHPPPPSPSPPKDLATFFELPWTALAEPEVLFIRRAAREGDRWTGHVALPGGKREAGETDVEAAVRETWEEVGLDLRGEGVLRAGGVAGRVIAAAWGSRPLMVLSTFVFLLPPAPDPPQLLLQPAEVASAHWVPLSRLLSSLSSSSSPTTATTVTTDVAERLAQRRGPWVRRLLRLLLGRMEFGAARLEPRGSVSVGGESESEPELLLWGITLGVVVDFLARVHGAPPVLRGWRWPTFTAPDVRMVVAGMTRRVRARNWARAVEAEEAGEAKVNGSVVGALMEGYYGVVGRAVWLAMAGRVVGVAAAVGVLVWRYGRGR